jgi:hypothetical protein
MRGKEWRIMMKINLLNQPAAYIFKNECGAVD